MAATYQLRACSFKELHRGKIRSPPNPWVKMMFAVPFSHFHWIVGKKPYLISYDIPNKNVANKKTFKQGEPWVTLIFVGKKKAQPSPFQSSSMPRPVGSFQKVSNPRISQTLDPHLRCSQSCFPARDGFNGGFIARVER